MLCNFTQNLFLSFLSYFKAFFGVKQCTLYISWFVKGLCTRYFGPKTSFRLILFIVCRDTCQVYP